MSVNCYCGGRQRPADVPEKSISFCSIIGMRSSYRVGACKMMPAVPAKTARRRDSIRRMQNATHIKARAQPVLVWSDKITLAWSKYISESNTKKTEILVASTICFTYILQLT
uniref:Uncharacterized protein n=1 Tax=Glossina pallidipes TaxID=7398 RepID=A0A1A9ZZ63_GLOPL